MSPSVTSYQQSLDRATSSSSSDGIPNAAVISADGDGHIVHKIESGSYLPNARNPNRTSDSAQQKFTADTVCWIASCTKIMTTVAVMQCVERGILNLDDDVSRTHLPEFKDAEVLIRMEDDGKGGRRPLLKRATRKVTLRNLLTHTSGLSYEFTHPKLNAWREWAMENTPDGRDNARSSDIAVAHKIPLLFEPDQGWVYGYGIDWAGLAVMRATGSTLEAYMAKHIWGPLGMASTTFSLSDHRPDLLARFAAMTLRDDEGNLSVADRDAYSHRAERVKYGGGGGCFSTANDYIRFLSSLLNTATGAPAALPQLLSRATVEGMFAPRLAPAADEMLRRTIDSPLAFGLAGDLPRSVRASFGLGGLLTLSKVPATGRSAGGMQWGGLPNLFWWVSPADNRCGCYFGQLLPPGDVVSFRLYQGFEKAVLSDNDSKGKL